MKVIILCAGLSKRMSYYGIPKYLLPLGSETVLQRHLRMWDGHNVVVIGRSGIQYPDYECEYVILDDVYGNAFDTIKRVAYLTEGDTLFLLGDTVYDEEARDFMRQKTGESIILYGNEYPTVWTDHPCDYYGLRTTLSALGLSKLLNAVNSDLYSLHSIKAYYNLPTRIIQTIIDLDYPADYIRALHNIGLPWKRELLNSPIRKINKIKMLLDLK